MGLASKNAKHLTKPSHQPINGQKYPSMSLHKEARRHLQHPSSTYMTCGGVCHFGDTKVTRGGQAPPVAVAAPRAEYARARISLSEMRGE